MLADIRRVTGLGAHDIDTVVNTHANGDHTHGNAVLDRATAGDIRRAGGEVIADGTPRNPNHATVNGLSAEKLEELFKVIDNPVPPAERGL